MKIELYLFLYNRINTVIKNEKKIYILFDINTKIGLFESFFKFLFCYSFNNVFTLFIFWKYFYTCTVYIFAYLI